MLNNVFSYCSWVENEWASYIIDFVDCHKYYPISKQEIDRFLYEYHIDYYELPQYLKDKLDELDVIG